jgi:hypothetical protein
MKKNLQIGKQIALALILLVTATVVNAQRTASATGVWSDPLTWGGSSVPTSSDAVTINSGVTVTVDVTANCASLTFLQPTTANSTVVMGSGISLTVAGTITIPRPTNTPFINALNVNAGTVNAAAVAFTNDFGGGNRHQINITTGTLNVSGNIGTNAGGSSATITFTGAGLLQVGGTFFTTGGTITPSTGTIEYDGAGAQTVKGITYNNLVLSNSGAKTVTGSTVNGSLILRGTATATGTAPSYGGSAVLEYNGSAAQTPSTSEFPNTMGADVLINNTAGVTLNATKTINGNLTVNSGSTLTLPAFGITVTGTTTIAGTFVSSSTTGTKQFDNMVISSGGVFNSTAVGENYDMTGNLQVDGTLTAGTGTWTWTASGAFSGTAAIANITVAGTGTVVLTNNGNLTSSNLLGADQFTQGAAGVLNYSGVTIGVGTLNASAAGNIVNYTLAGAQTVEPATYSNLVLSGSGSKTLTGVTVNDKLSMQGTATAGTTFTYSSAALEYKGSAAQTTSNNEYPAAGTNINQVIIDNAAGVTLNGAKALTGALTLTNGDLITTNTNLLTLGVGSTTSGGSASSHVNGPLSKTGNTNFTFPVGNGSIYRPISISGLSASATVRATYFLVNPRTAVGTAGTGPSFAIKDISACEYWDLDDGLSTITGTVGLEYSSTSPCNSNGYITNAATLVVAHWNGASWDNLSATAGTTLTNMTALNPSAFSPFTIGTTNSQLNPLPVTFTDVKAAEKGTAVQIDWTNSTESDMSVYIIERSANGVDFTAIGQTAPRSNQFDRVSYTFLDAAPLAGTNFYRIKAIELSGKNVYSRSLRVDIGRSPKGISLYPNPVKGTEITIGFSASKGQYSLNVVNTAGQVVFKQQVNHAGGTVAQTVSLPASLKSGVYNLLISGDNYKETKMFVIQ